MKTSSGPKRMRSAKAPTISAGVIAAKVSWNIANTDFRAPCAIRLSRVMPARKALVEAADEAVPVDHAGLHALGAEGQAVAVGDPQHADQRDDREALHQHAEHVLGPHQAAVEQRQAGQAHHQHQQAGGQHPGGVAAVDGRRRGAGEGGRGRTSRAVSRHGTGRVVARGRRAWRRLRGGRWDLHSRAGLIARANRVPIMDPARVPDSGRRRCRKLPTGNGEHA